MGGGGGDLKFDNETIKRELQKTWHTITKQHLNSIFTAYEEYTSSFTSKSSNIVFRQNDQKSNMKKKINSNVLRGYFLSICYTFLGRF